MTRPAPGARTNEDHLVVGLQPVPHAVVCDGAGNADGAAHRACRLFKQLLTATPVQDLTAAATWLGFLTVLDAHVIGIGESTCIGGALVDRRFVGAYVGDSRAYRWRPNGEVELLTTVPSKARLGSGRARGEALDTTLVPGERLFLMSDGVWTPFETPERLSALLSSRASLPLYRLSESLLDAVMQTGHQDDMTVAIIEA